MQSESKAPPKPQRIQAVKGMNDFLAEDVPRWREVEEKFRAHTGRYGYREVRTPIVEPTELFVRSIGEVTDIVEKEMYSFVYKDEHALTLRPEGTASIVRAYLEHTVQEREPVTKWIYLGPMFRGERPAKGRYRQFHQAGAELFGDEGPFSDAEMIDMLVGFFRSLGVLDVEVLINSIGSPETKVKYREALVRHLEPLRAGLSEDSQRRLEKNPLRVLDSKNPKDLEAIEQAPNILDFLAESDRAHWDGLRNALDALGTPYRVEPKLVRGLDYYTRTLFEVRGRGGELGAQNAICGGGRYDGLVESLGGPKTPAIGFAIGLERLLMTLGEAPSAPYLDACVLCVGPSDRGHALSVARALRDAGIRTECDVRGQSLKSQMRRADKLSARAVVVIGGSETERGVVQLKDLANKTQVEVPVAEVAARVRQVLAVPVETR